LGVWILFNGWTNKICFPDIRCDNSNNIDNNVITRKFKEKRPITAPKKTWGDSGFRKVGSSWLPLSRADRKVLQIAPRFLAAKRWHQAIK
jgi:hypothetical protein